MRLPGALTQLVACTRRPARRPARRAGRAPKQGAPLPEVLQPVARSTAARMVRRLLGVEASGAGAGGGGAASSCGLGGAPGNLPGGLLACSRRRRERGHPAAARAEPAQLLRGPFAPRREGEPPGCSPHIKHLGSQAAQALREPAPARARREQTRPTRTSAGVGRSRRRGGALSFARLHVNLALRHRVRLPADGARARAPRPPHRCAPKLLPPWFRPASLGPSLARRCPMGTWSKGGGAQTPHTAYWP